MPRISQKPLERICVRLWKDDYEFIQQVSEATGEYSNLIIRQIVHSYVTHTRDRERRAIDQTQEPRLDPEPQAPEPQAAE